MRGCRDPLRPGRLHLFVDEWRIFMMKNLCALSAILVCCTSAFAFDSAALGKSLASGEDITKWNSGEFPENKLNAISQWFSLSPERCIDLTNTYHHYYGPAIAAVAGGKGQDPAVADWLSKHRYNQDIFVPGGSFATNLGHVLTYVSLDCRAPVVSKRLDECCADLNATLGNYFRTTTYLATATAVNSQNLLISMKYCVNLNLWSSQQFSPQLLSEIATFVCLNQNNIASCLAFLEKLSDLAFWTKSKTEPTDEKRQLIELNNLSAKNFDTNSTLMQNVKSLIDILVVLLNDPKDPELPMMFIEKGKGLGFKLSTPSASAKNVRSAEVKRIIAGIKAGASTSTE